MTIYCMIFQFINTVKLFVVISIMSGVGYYYGNI